MFNWNTCICFVEVWELKLHSYPSAEGFKNPPEDIKKKKGRADATYFEVVPCRRRMGLTPCASVVWIGTETGCAGCRRVEHTKTHVGFEASPPPPFLFRLVSFSFYCIGVFLWVINVEAHAAQQQRRANTKTALPGVLTISNGVYVYTWHDTYHLFYCPWPGTAST